MSHNRRLHRVVDPRWGACLEGRFGCEVSMESILGGNRQSGKWKIAFRKNFFGGTEIDRPRPARNGAVPNREGRVLDSRLGFSLVRVCFIIPGGGFQSADGKVIVIALYASCNHKSRDSRLFSGKPRKFSCCGIFVTGRSGIGSKAESVHIVGSPRFGVPAGEVVALRGSAPREFPFLA